MFAVCTPEEVGISSESIKKYIGLLEENRLSTHNVIIARGNKICFEKYWAPFHKDFLHRIYSCTKSFVSLAIGFLEQEGKLSLDDPIGMYFSEEVKNQKDENLKNQTIRHMLMMSTAKPIRFWFPAKPKDRVQFYFENDRPESRPSGSIFQYDSTGSFVLGALVERLTGKPFIDYLREKCLDEIGFSKEAYCLRCPGGHSWGDSALLCTARDFLTAARFVLNGGSWNGKQYLNREYITAATSKQIDTNNWMTTDHDSYGYGYQFWRTQKNSFFFSGMGCQLAVCVPEKDLILIYNGDNQGVDYSYKLIMDSFFKIIVDNIKDAPLPQNFALQKELEEESAGLKLATAIGKENSPWVEKICGKTFSLGENPMGIKTLRLEFEGKKGKMHYTNAQGDKTLEFGMCENVFGLFPEEGYSAEVGTVYAPGNYYKCAASGAWVSSNQLFIKVQIIDIYFGNLNIMLGFKDNGVGIYMKKNAEDFLKEYDGYAGGTMV